MGKMLLVDLSRHMIKEESLGENICRDFIGGPGLGVNILYEYMKGGIDPLGPENWLGFVTGPLTGTKVPMSGRFTAVTKSPLTGTLGESNAGGFWGPRLKAAGYDAVFFSGVSPKPVYLSIDEGEVFLKDATYLWGKDTVQTTEAIQNELGDSNISVACIGPSGELLSLISAVIVDKWRILGRMGIGAVMGSKNLKAVAVRGFNKVTVADPSRLENLRGEFLKAISTSNILKGLKDKGTPIFIEGAMPGGATPVKNWRLMGEEAMPSFINLTSENLKEYMIRRHGCFGCPVACGTIVGVKNGYYKVDEARGPEYETLASLGPLCFNDNIESIIKANDICDRYGIDTISAGAVVAFAMECLERNIIGKEELGNLELIWGNHKAILTILEKVARREGFGDVLADGVKKAAERIGHGALDFAINIHGQEPAMHDPRYRPSWGTMYVCDPTPGHHTQSAQIAFMEGGGLLRSDPIFKVPKLPLYGNYEAKGPLYALGSCNYQLLGSSGMCLYSMFAGPPIAEFITAVTGWNFSLSEGLVAGRRIQTIRQAFNLRDGLTPDQFSLPGRISQPPPMGPYAGEVINFDILRNAYFSAMNWDPLSGKPYPNELARLGLEHIIKDLWG